MTSVRSGMEMGSRAGGNFADQDVADVQAIIAWRSQTIVMVFLPLIRLIVLIRYHHAPDPRTPPPIAMRMVAVREPSSVEDSGDHTCLGLSFGHGEWRAR
jgi:hypothetical protein